MDSNVTINEQVSDILRSNSVPLEEIAQRVRELDTTSKIRIITSTYRLEERTIRVKECLRELKDRNSLVNLLLLKCTFQTIDRHDSAQKEAVWRSFLASDGRGVLQGCFTSNSKNFLDNLLEFIVFLQREKGAFCEILPVILSKYDLIDKALLATFINEDVDRSALMCSYYQSGNISISKCYCSTYLRRIILEILKFQRIDKELNFLLNFKEIGRVLERDELLQARDRFVDTSTYFTILSIMSETASSCGTAVNRDFQANLIKKDHIAQTPNTHIREDYCPKALLEEPTHPTQSTKMQVSLVDESQKISAMKLCSELENLKIENQALKSKLSKAVVDNMTAIKQRKKILVKCVDFTSKTAIVYNSNANVITESNASSTGSENKQSDGSVNLGKTLKGGGLFGKKRAAETSASGSTISNPVSTSTASNPTPAISNQSSVATSSTLSPPNPILTTNNQEISKPRLGFRSKPNPVEATLKPSKSYTNLAWNKLKKAHSQIFTKINYEECEKAFELREFDSFEQKQARKVAFTTNLTPSKQTPTLALMDPKKSYSLNIALGTVKMSNNVLVEKILRGTYDNRTVIEQLIKHLPTQEEYDQITECRDIHKLDKAERLFKELESLNKFYSALLSLRFSLTFRNRNYQEIVKSASGSFKRIVSSPELLKLFGTLLVIGNVLNFNTFRGNAEGFSLDSLQCFQDNKSVMELIKKKVDVRKLNQELTGKSVGSSRLVDCDVPIDTLIREVEEIKEFFGEFVKGEDVVEYKKVMKEFEEFQEVYKEAQSYFGDSGDSFVPKIESFLSQLQ